MEVTTFHHIDKIALAVDFYLEANRRNKQTVEARAGSEFQPLRIMLIGMYPLLP